MLVGDGLPQQIAQQPHLLAQANVDFHHLVLLESTGSDLTATAAV